MKMSETVNMCLNEYYTSERIYHIQHQATDIRQSFKRAKLGQRVTIYFIQLQADTEFLFFGES